MKILLVSDSHCNNEALEKLSKLYPNCDYYLHLGDSESDEFQIRPFVSVKGNCDYYHDFNNYLVIPTPLGNIFACHSPYISKDELLNYKAHFFIHGHTHIRRHEIKNGFVCINPGAISYSRDGHDLSFAILEINEKNYEIIFFEIV